MINLVKLCFSSPKITHLFRQFHPPTEDFLSNAPTQPPHSRVMRIFSHPQSAQMYDCFSFITTADAVSQIGCTQGNNATQNSSDMCQLMPQLNGICQSSERRISRPLYTRAVQVQTMLLHLKKSVV